MEEHIPLCISCGFPLKPFQYAMQVCTDCVQASQLRQDAPQYKTPGYRWQKRAAHE